MFRSLITSLLFSFSIKNSILDVNGNTIYSNQCGESYEDVIFINSQNDLNNIENCSYLNASLFVNGDYNMNSLSSLKNLNTIEGYFVLIDSHRIGNLKGLNNLERINGRNTYLENYGVSIKYNNNIDENSTGLCFSELVDWNRITNHSIIIINNGNNCPNTCHSECNSCLVQVLNYVNPVLIIFRVLHVFKNVLMEQII